jgi:SNF2 family DNA or RNA helicase
MIRKVLVIAPLRVAHSVWPGESTKWSDFEKLRIQVLHGAKKDQLLKEDADIYVINPEGLDWLVKPTKTKMANGKTKVTVDLKKFKALGFDMLVIDELTKFKNHTSIRFKTLKEVHKSFAWRWGLTGSPAANGLLGLFGQAYILDEGRSLGPYITKYRDTYFDQVDDAGFVYKPKEGAKEQIYKRIAPLALRMAAEDYLDLPELVPNKIEVELPESARKIYNGLEEHLVAVISDTSISAANKAVASGKCRQVANGGIYKDQELTEFGFKLPTSKREWFDLHTAKVDALADLVEELQGEPLLVAYDFGHDLARIQEALGMDVPYIGGGVSIKRSKELEALWNAGKLPVLLGHPQSIAHGMNLQEVGRHVCWHSLTWDFELYDQYIRRLLRQGSKAKQIMCHHIVAKDTIDEVMMYSTKAKDKNQQHFFKGILELNNMRKTKKNAIRA